MLDRDGERYARVRVPANTVVHVASLKAAAVRFPTPDLPPIAPAPFGFAPILVRDEKSARAAEKALLAALRKPEDGWTSTHLNRPISLRLTRWLVQTPLVPNQVSPAILGVGLLGAALAAKGTYGAQLAGALLFHAQSVLDGCDGEMSRLTFRQSHLGEWLDTIGDDLTNYAFFAGATWGLYAATGRASYVALGATWGLYAATGRASYVALGLFIVSAGGVASGLEYRYLLRIGSGDLLRYPIGSRARPATLPQGVPLDGKRPRLARIVDAVSPLFKRDTFVLLTLIGAALGCLGPLLVAFAVGAALVLSAVLRTEMAMAAAGAPKSACPSPKHPPSPRQVDPIELGD